MRPLDLSSSFEEVVQAVSSQYRPGSDLGGPARNAVIEMWGQLVGRSRALQELELTIDKYGSLSKTAKALAARPDTIKRFKAFFESLPIEPEQSREKYKMGDILGGWRLRTKLGSGGNAVVWKATKNNLSGAIKICLADRYRNTALARFRFEVEVLQRLSDVNGVLPLIDYYLPFEFQKIDIPWLIMPVAEQLPHVLLEANPQTILGAFVSIARTMSIVHSRGISHRDLKPENLFLLNSEWSVGDFGLASFPDKQDLTQENKKLGPTFYIAPEMLNDAASSDGKMADVYSLSKALWVTLSGLNFPLPGVLRQDESVTKLSTYRPGTLAITLEPLFQNCTQNDPRARPPMSFLAAELERIANQ